MLTRFRITLLIALAVGLALLVHGPAQDARPAQAQAGSPAGLVAFVGADATDTTGETADIYLLDVASGTVGRLDVAATVEADLDWQPDGDMLAFTTADGGYGVLESLAGCFSGAGVCRDVSLYESDDPVLDLEWTPDGAWLLVNTGEVISMLSPLGSALPLDLTVASTCANGFEVAAPEPYFLCAYPDAGTAGLINLYELGDLEDGALQLDLLADLGAHPEITALAVGPGGQAAVGTVEPVGDSGHVLDADGESSRIAPVQIHVYDLDFAPDGSRIAVVGATADSTGDGSLSDGDTAELSLYEYAEGALQHAPGFTGATAVAWSPGGGHVLVAVDHERFMLLTVASEGAKAQAADLPPDVAIHGLAWAGVEVEAALPAVPAATPGQTQDAPLTVNTPLPTIGIPPSPIPTLTPFATNTPRPTFTPQPTITPWPTRTPGSPMGSGCEFAYAGGGGLPVAVGDTAQVTGAGAGLRLRSAPGLTATQLRELRSGARMVILAGPQCSTGYRWWQVRLESDGTTGWVADSDLGGYWIEVATAPPPELPPAMMLEFYADRNVISPGECVTLTWNLEGIKEVYYLGDGSIEVGVTGHETRTECPASSTTYFLRVVHTDNSISLMEVTVQVYSGPPMVTFEASDAWIADGTCVTISWEILGFNHLDFTYDGLAGPTQVGSAIGSVVECPSPGTHTFRLWREIGGTITHTWSVEVNTFLPL